MTFTLVGACFLQECIFFTFVIAYSRIPFRGGHTRDVGINPTKGDCVVYNKSADIILKVDFTCFYNVIYMG